MSTPGPRKRILSGVQPSAKLHIGNYFGAIKQHIALQNEGECFYFIADYHAMTTLKEAAERDIEEAKQQGRKARKPVEILRDNVRDVALDYLALGLDPAKAVFFRQSDVPEVSELAWILSTVTGMGLLERAHSFKDKVSKGVIPSVGLFTYPILMAADILIYRSNIVPVGKDQEQHLEITRDIAGYFHQAYSVEVFPLPEARFDEVPIVPGTDGKKMSKSSRPSNAIEIFAEGKALKRAVMGIVTDSTSQEDPKNPDTCNLFALYKLFSTPEEQHRLAEQYRAGGLGYAKVKEDLLGRIDVYFAPAREKRKELAAKPELAESVLEQGARQARAEAIKTMAKVRKAVGLLPRPVTG